MSGVDSGDRQQIHQSAPIDSSNFVTISQFANAIDKLSDRVNKDHNRSFFSRNTAVELFISTAPVTLTAIAGLLLVNWLYGLERKAASPILSVEYAYFSDIGSVEKDPMIGIYEQIVISPYYMDFLVKNRGRNDFRFIDAMADDIGAGDAKKLIDTTYMFKGFLENKEIEIDQKIDEIPTMKLSESRMHGRSMLDSITDMDESEIKKQLVSAFQKEKKNLNDQKMLIEAMSAMLAKISNHVFVKLSIWNRGGRDGLVRPVGWIQYAGSCYRMVRVDAPPMSDTPNAIPTFVVNRDTSSVTQTVGKIDSDSMVEYWFEVREPAGNRARCGSVGSLDASSSVADPVIVQVCEDGSLATTSLEVQEEEMIRDVVLCSGPIL